MPQNLDIFQRMLAGGIIRNDEMGEAWEVVFRAQRLSPALNTSTATGEMRECLSEIIGPKVNLITENHPIDPTMSKYLDLKRILIKRNAWVGAGATTLPVLPLEKTRSLLRGGSQ